MILVVGPQRFRERLSEIVRVGGFTPGGCDTLEAALELLPLTRPAGVVIDWPTKEAGAVNMLDSLMDGPCAPELCVLVAEIGADMASANAARGRRGDVSLVAKPVNEPTLIKILKEGANP